jgi:putative ABC transport system permease protein
MRKEVQAANRAMFWRIIGRLLGANRGRLFVILLALGAGAAVSAALLNLQVDAQRRLTTEFRAFGSNILIASKSTNTAASESLLLESVTDQIPSSFEGRYLYAVPFLYLVSTLSSENLPSMTPVTIVVAGTRLGNLKRVAPQWKLEPAEFLPGISKKSSCILGKHVADRVHLRLGMELILRNGSEQERCIADRIVSTGAAEDDQVLVELPVAQHLALLPSRISLIQISVDGTQQEIDRFVDFLSVRVSDAAVRPIRQFTEGEAQIYNRISGLLSTTVGIVLLLTSLCVMAAMTNVAMERKMDVGLMKAIGGATRSVILLFLAEAALLGLAGGMIGAAAGIFLSIGLGKAVFGIAASPRLIVYPVSVVLTILVSILSSYPLRRLASIRPASVFRGEA